MKRVNIDIGLLRYIFNLNYNIILYIKSCGSMNSVVIDIRLLRYIFNQKYEIFSIYLITRFHEQCDYRYLTFTIYLEFKI